MSRVTITPTLLLAASLFFFAGACPVPDPVDDDDTADDDGSGDDDDSASGDDDDAGDGDCPLVDIEGETEDVPCDWEAGGGDVWQVVVPQGSRVDMTVDTVAADTTFDPRFVVLDAIGGYVTTGDDECTCAFVPTGDYGCPTADHTALDFTEALTIHVGAFVAEGCDGREAGEYVLRVAVDGAPVEVRLIRDDEPNYYNERGE